MREIGALDGMVGAETLQQALHGLFEAAIRATRAEEPGCMMSTGSVENAVEQADLARELAGRRYALRERVAEGLRRWLDRPDVARLAAYLSAVQQGLSVQARDSATAEELSRIAKDSVAGILARN